MPELTLVERLRRIEALELEIIQKSASIIGAGTDIFYADFFFLGALRRTLAQARGFRDMIVARNFPCAAAILRLQLDTAMRVNALSLVEDVNKVCKAILDGEQFNHVKDRQGVKLTDVHLRRKLAEEHQWIDPIYIRTSDFVHLSGRHFDQSIAHANDDARTAFFQISDQDPDRPEETYFEIVNAFFDTTKLAGTLLLASWIALHQSSK